MEFTNKQSEQTVETFTNNLHEQINTDSTKKVEKVRSFSEHAFEKAGLNRGEHQSLKTYLKWISDGHLVDDSYNENEQQLLKQQLQNKISIKEVEKEKVDGEKRTAVEIAKPSIELKIKDLKDEIQQTNIDLIDKKIKTGYEPIRFWSYVGLTILLTFYLIFFYASSIYSAFFRNPETMLKNAGGDIAMLLDSIFDPKGIFTLSTALIFAYLGSFIFFAIGMAPHGILNGNSKSKKMIASSIIFFALLADAAMAFKIDKGLHDLKLMAGIPDLDWKFYESINFYLVLLFGFAAYLVWGFTYEMMLKEKNKKTGDIRAAFIITGLKAEIKSLREDLKIIEIQIIELETQIKSILSQMEQLRKNLENRMLNPDALSQNLTSFYMGWRQFLNGTSDENLEKLKCETTFNDFMESQFNQTVILN